MKNKTKYEIYLEWVNDWLTVAKMAEHYGMNENDLIEIINDQRKIANSDI